MRLPAFLICAGIATAVVLQHPLVYRKSQMIENIERREYAAYVKYRNALRSSSLITLEHRMLDYGDGAYSANITIGTPDQQFAVVIDTGSALLWIPGHDCNSSCGGEHKFQPSLSSTFVESNMTWSIMYGKGEAHGVLGTDTLGGLMEKKLPVPNTTFGLAEQISGYQVIVADGILGLALGFPVSKVVPVLMNAINQNLLDKPLFTVWMQQLRRQDGKSEGLLTYGAIDTKNCGPVIDYVPLTSATDYQFKMSDIGAGSQTFPRPYQAVSDTGSTFIAGPKAIIDLLAKVVGAVYNATENLYTISCNATPPTVDITIGTNKYLIYPVNYISKAGKRRCFFAFLPFNFGGFGPDWVLGFPFIRQFCNIFDIGGKRMGFAKSLQN